MGKFGSLIVRYYNWLHGQWPAGVVEKLPAVKEDGTTALSGVRIIGDLTGIPLLKFSVHSGANAVKSIVKESDFKPASDPDVLDLAIVGAGVSGMAAAKEATNQKLNFEIYEASQPFSTIVNFPKGKPIYTYPTDMTPAGDFQAEGAVKETLLENMEHQRKEAGIEPKEARVEQLSRENGRVILQMADGKKVAAQRVIVAIGRSGNFRKLNVPGEELDKVSNRLHDPKDFCDQNVMVVGGGDSAMETAIALASCGAHVTLSYRKKEFSRPKPDNLEKLQQLVDDPDADVGVAQPSSERVTTAASSRMREGEPGSVTLAMATQPKEIRDDAVILNNDDGDAQEIPNDYVFAMIGREPPLGFFRKSGVPITNERTKGFWISMVIVLMAFVVLYQWKKGNTWLPINEWFKQNNWFPFNIGDWWNSLGGAFNDPSTLLGTLSFSVGDPGFYYSFLYTSIIIIFGILRIRRRKTPYITRQTSALMAFQLIPLFLIPYILLPWAGFNGWFDEGFGKAFADSLFPEVNYGSGREYWRAFGLILAWPLFLFNVFTSQPIWAWLIISLIQTFVIIPFIIYRWGKGAYCGWVCSCGAMAETLGDTQRHKMPHGPFWNKVNMIGQIFLAIAFLILFFKLITWFVPGVIGDLARSGVKILEKGWTGDTMMPWGYFWFVDLLWAGILGFGLYFHFSGRVWCRFACPLAALMHIYSRFSKFRIFSEKKKCISCNVCTSVCHQGIDVMNFANKGIGMNDPECVRCSACVQSCPTGVLSFGRYAADGKVVLDQVPASPVQMQEAEAKPSE